MNDYQGHIAASAERKYRSVQYRVAAVQKAFDDQHRWAMATEVTRNAMRTAAKHGLKVTHAFEVAMAAVTSLGYNFDRLIERTSGGGLIRGPRSIARARVFAVMRRNGLSYEEIASVFSVSHTTVSEAIRDLPSKMAGTEARSESAA